MRLSSFILEHMEEILQSWEDFARTIEPPALTMGDADLRDHAQLMLKTIAADLKTSQTPEEQSEKSQGEGQRSSHDSYAEIHAAARLVSGYTIDQLVSEYRALRASVLKLWSESDRTGLATDAEDITRFNEAIDQALAESVGRYAKMVKQSQNMFLAILGHDLRNPLGSVIMLGQLLMRSELDSKNMLAASRIVKSGQKMSKLVDDLLDFTRVHLGARLPVSPVPANIALICRQAVDEIRAVHPERNVLFHATGELDGSWDTVRIEQMFSNLLANAVQHGSKTGPITVTIGIEAEMVVATVHNEGGQIAPEKQPFIFEPLIGFAAIDQDIASRPTNLGLGLYITRQIVTAHNGSIEVHSTEEDGTTFTVRLHRQGCL